jgi:hypothetical protein
MPRTRADKILIAELARENERLVAALTDLRDHGLRADLNPTMDFGVGEGRATAVDMYQQMTAYLRSIDTSVRNQAAHALGESAS